MNGSHDNFIHGSTVPLTYIVIRCCNGDLFKMSDVADSSVMQKTVEAKSCPSCGLHPSLLF